MKKFKQLIKELPSKKVVFAFGRFQPPTIGHELLVNAVKKVAGKDAHVIYASHTQDAKKNPLSVDRKVYYLKRMFPGTNFMAAGGETRTLIEVAKQLNKKYKNLVMVAGSDRVPEYKRLLETYNGKEFHYDTVEVVSAGERDPDADDASGMSGTKMREAAKKGDFKLFKSGLPHTITTVDAKRLMNEIRDGMGVDKIKESVKFEVSSLREKYHNGEIFLIGECVEDEQGVYEILDRGTNYLTVVDSEGTMQKKWITEVSQTYMSLYEDDQHTENTMQISFKGYLTKNFDMCQGAVDAFNDLIHKGGDPVAILNAIKETDAYLGHEKAAVATQQAEQLDNFMEHVKRAKQYLTSLGDLEHHEYIDGHVSEMQRLVANYKEGGKEEAFGEELTVKTLKNSDKIKVGRMIASMLGVDKAESMSNPEQLVNTGLRKIRSKSFNPESLNILDRMLELADNVGIAYDKNLLHSKLKETVEVDKDSKYNLAKSILSYADYQKLKAASEGKPGSSMSNTSDTNRKMKVASVTEDAVPTPELFVVPDDAEEMSDHDIEAMINNHTDDELIEYGYDDEEVMAWDEDDQEEIDLDELEDDAEEPSKLQEVLSRQERIRAATRFKRTKAKRERKIQIALRKTSSNDVINKRARRMAIKMMKKRFAKKPLNKLSVAEKERLEQRIKNMKPFMNRVAMRLVPRVRRIERDRVKAK